jgi:3-hydroxybutyryl-CoA dehydrogenase
VDERFVVIGAGTMGVGIAYVAAGADYAVELVELDPGQRDRARDTVDQLWTKAVQSGRATAAAVAESRSRLTMRADLADVAPAPAIIVEAVPERLELKQAVLAQAAALGPQLLASNTSSIAIADLARALPQPERVLGLHFFNPVWSMPLLEIVVGTATNEATRLAAQQIAMRLGKESIVVRDQPGFATSRLGVALGLEAMRMLADGVATAADIDKAMVLGYRHPMGPLELTDLVGLDVRLDIARTLQAAYGDRFAPPPLLVDLVQQGHLGRKTGQGFYRWDGGVAVR